MALIYFTGGIASSPFISTWYGAALGGAIAGAAGAAANGTNILKGALTGGVTAAAFYGVGSAFSQEYCVSCYSGDKLKSMAQAAKIASHGVTGGLMSVLQKGKFGHGFASASFTQAFASSIDGIKGDQYSALRVAIAATIGGTASVLSGGKFANGAVTSAFSRLFSDEMLAQKGGVEWGKQAGATDADLAEAKRLWALAKTRRLADGSIPPTVQALLDLEGGSFKTTILVGSVGNSAAPDSLADAMNVNVGSAGTIKFNPWKVGAISGGVNRSPEASLVHEAFHVRQFNTGSLQSANMRQHAEIGAASIENWHRKAMGLSQRTAYGQWPVATH